MRKLLASTSLLFGLITLFFLSMGSNKVAAAPSESSDSQVNIGQTASDTNDSTGMVYATGEEWENVCAALKNAASEQMSWLDQYGLSIVEESISPVYSIKLEQLSVEKKLVLIPEYYYDHGAKGRAYHAKIVDKEGKYNGVVGFCYEKGEVSAATEVVFAKIYSDNPVIPASQSYADHAERIRKLLGAEKAIPPTDVRLVRLRARAYPSLLRGAFFYIHNADYQVVIPAGYVSENGTTDIPTTANTVIDMEMLQRIADRDEEVYQGMLRRNQQWEKEHPGQTAMLAGGVQSLGIPVNTSGAARGLNDINDVASYLNIDYTKNWDSSVALGADLKPYKKDNTVLLIILISAGVVLASGAVAFVIVYRRRKRMH